MLKTFYNVLQQGAENISTNLEKPYQTRNVSRLN